MISVTVRIAFAATVIAAALFLLSRGGPSTAHDASQIAATVSGRVIDAQAQPVSGLLVSAEGTGMVALSKEFWITNDEGEFVIPALPPGSYTLHTRKEDAGYPRTEFDFYEVGDSTDQTIQVQGGQPLQNVVIKLGQKAARLAGRVFDAATNEPLKGANITVRRVDFPDRFLSTGLYWHGVVGGFNFLVPSAPITLEVSVPGYEKWNYKALVNGRESSALLLQPDTTKTLSIALKPVKRNDDNAEKKTLNDGK
jgi:hypothetical protein